MKEAVKKAKAKINLTLEIFDKRGDGYHDMRSVMHKIGLCDTVKVQIFEDSDSNDAGKISVICSKPVCEERDNLAYKAADAYMAEYYKKTGKVFGCRIEIEKNIPEKAGLGGGSADCAAVLDALSVLCGEVSERKVEEIASTLGSDVPFMLEKYDCALATGTGTTLRVLPMMPVCYCVIGTPSVGLSTREIYDLFDQKKNLLPSVRTSSMIAALEQEDFTGVCDCIVNQFEPLCIHEYPEIGKIKRKLLKHGAFASSMSGSGSAVFGLFSTENQAVEAYEALTGLPFQVKRSICRI